MHSLFGCGIAAAPFRCRSPRSRFHGDWDARRHAGTCWTLVEEHHEELAALILEPVAQGAGGMWFYHPQYLREATRICREHGLLADLRRDSHRASGGQANVFALGARGRGTGHHVHRQSADGRIHDAVRRADHKRSSGFNFQSCTGAFMHGPTFMGNPLACAVACASIRLLTSPEYDWQGKVSSHRRPVAA